MKDIATMYRRTVTLGQIAEFRNGVNFVASQRGQGIPVLGVKNFQDRSQPDYVDLEQLTPDAVKEESLLRAGDILFVRSNGNKELIGRSIFFRADPPRPTTHSAFTIRMRILSPDADPQFCAYSMRGGVVRRTLSAQGSGTSISNLNQDILSRLQILLPPLDVQRRIAGILSTYDDLMEVNIRRIALLEEMARRVFDEWFVKFRFPGHESAEWVMLKNQRVPKNWTQGRLANVVALKKQATKPGTHLSSRRYVPIDCIGKKTLFLSEALDFSEAQSSLQLFDKGDILFGAMRAYFHKITIAPFDGVTRSTCFVLGPKIPGQHAFATFLMFHESTVAYAARHSKGATIPYASWDRSLADMPVVMPTDKLITRFGILIDPLVEFVQSMFFVQRALRAARDLLLPKLISGEIDLSAAEREIERATDHAAAE